MAKLPTVAIIGRPNTGKSTLFNRIVGKRRAIVSDVAGTTRDHVVHKVESDRMDYLLLDTGGIGGGSTDKDFEDDVSRQSLIALEAADLIVFTLNSQEEMTAADFEVVDILRKKKKRHVPVILVPTKCDNFEDAENRMAQYYGLGLGDAVMPVSAVHRIGLDELEERIVEELQTLHFSKEPSDTANTDRPPRVAVIGKPNVGKSSIVNALMSDPQRALSSRLVSDIPGTTRDSSDSVIRYDDREYIFVDTAGLRRKARVDEDLETISAIKSIQAMEDSDVTILVLDASDVVAKQDKRIAGMAADEGKCIIIVLNKADKLTSEERKEKEGEVRAMYQFCRWAPILFVSAQTRENLPKLFALIDMVVRNRARRIADKDLRRWFEGIITRLPARELNKTKHLTQADEIPPTFILFTKNPKNIDVTQLRALENSLRSTFGFEGTPIRWITKGREDE